MDTFPKRIEQFQSEFDFILFATAAVGTLGGKFTLSNNAHPYRSISIS